MTILLLGKHGQLGWELQRTLAPLGPVIALDYPAIDLTRPDSARQWVRETAPQIIVNAAAYTAVDRAEAEPALAQALNATAPGILAEEASRQRAALVHISTEFVFDGAAARPYVETDLPNPLSVYGKTKLAGDQAVEQAGGAYFIFRTSWVYSLRRPSFVTKVLEWSRKQPVLQAVTDEVGSPTWARALAEAIGQVLAMGNADPFGWVRERRGLYHLGGEGAASRFDLAKAVWEFDPAPEKRTAAEILPALSAAFPSPAARPAYAPLDCTRFHDTFGLRLPPWQAALQMALEP